MECGIKDTKYPSLVSASAPHRHAWAHTSDTLTFIHTYRTFNYISIHVNIYIPSIRTYTSFFQSILRVHFYFMYTDVFSVCVCLCTVCMKCPQRPKRSFSPLGLELYGCKSPCGCKGSNPNPLEEQPIISKSEPFPHPLILIF